MKKPKQPDLEPLLALLISDGAREIELECSHGEWWVNVSHGNTGLGVAHYTEPAALDRVDQALDRLRKEKRISVNGKSYALSFRSRDSFGEPTWTIRVKESNPSPTT
jgi:hypothetical protein